MSEVTINRVASLRKQQRQAAASLSDLTLSTDHDPRDMPRTDVSLYYPNKYGDVGRALFLNFYQQIKGTCAADSIAGPGSFYGALVITKILSYMPPAYVEFCKTTDQPASAAGLGTILRDNTDIYDRLANMGLRANNTLETVLGLKQLPPMFSDRQPFVFTKTEDGVTINPEAEHLHYAKMEIATRIRNGDLDAHDPIQTCPARGQLLNKFWLAGVVECETNPNLFAADIAQLSQAQD